MNYKVGCFYIIPDDPDLPVMQYFNVDPGDNPPLG